MGPAADEAALETADERELPLPALLLVLLALEPLPECTDDALDPDPVLVWLPADEDEAAAKATSSDPGFCVRMSSAVPSVFFATTRVWPVGCTS